MKLETQPEKLIFLPVKCPQLLPIETGSNMAASASAIRDRGISVTTWGESCHGNTFVTDNSCAGA